MRKIELPDLRSTLEPGYFPVAVDAAEVGGALRLSVICRTEADPAAGHLVLIRRLAQATIYLGCVADAAGRPVEWLEVWVQNAARPEAAHPSYARGLTNAALDLQWDGLAAQLRALDEESYLSTLYETQAGAPGWLDVAGAKPFSPQPAEGGAPWRLCRDDSTLEAAGLPTYGGSLMRYLREGEVFVPLTPGAPVNEKTRPLHEIAPPGAGFAALNPLAGRMLFRRLAPLALEDFCELLGGRPWRGVENARKAFHPGGVYALLEDEDLLRCGAAHLFSAASGRAGRLAESLHLKTQLLRQCFYLVRNAIQRTQLPLLNLSADSFRVSLGATGLDLPLLWTNKAALTTPGSAFALPITNSQERYFQTVEPLPASIYRPAELAVPKSGVGSVRLRKVTPGAEGTVIEGTLTTWERIGLDESELIWLQLPVPEGKVDLYGFRDTSQAMAAGEALFRTIPQQLSPSAQASLQSVAGVPFSQVMFSILPPLSSPCDLYSLGVLAVRLLLVNARNPLPQALDALLSLARQVANEAGSDRPIGERVAQIAAGDPRWQETLGPQQLRAEEVPLEEAALGVPPRLWWDLLAFVTRLFPGTGPDSFCRGFGDVPPLALHSAFERPMEELGRLCRRTRALVTLEWERNLEIASVIKAAEVQCS